MSTFTEPVNSESNNFVSNLIKYVNWVLIKLATDSSIDHRGYNDSETKSKLMDLFETNSDLTLSVSTICEELNSDQGFLDQVQTTMELFGLVKTQEESEQVEESDEDVEEELYEAKEELFNYVHYFVGLNEVNSLHGDFQDKFKDKFFKVVLGI